MQRPRELTSSLSMYPALTPTLLPATHTNSFALGGRDVLLVEPATPYADEQKEWLAWARSLASRGRTPIAIFATHHHADHTGGLDVLSRELDLPVWAHELTAKRLTPALQERITRRLTDEERIVLEGPYPESWRVLHTPGHAPGHLCLFEEGSRAAVVGDMVAGVGTILIAPGDGDMQLYLQQLDRLAELNVSVALPAHGDPIDEPTKLFRFYISHRLAREAKVLAAVVKAGADGADSASLVPEAYADTPPHIWPIAKLSLEMHLEKLVREGKVAMDGATVRAVAG